MGALANVQADHNRTVLNTYEGSCLASNGTFYHHIEMSNEFVT